MNPPPASVFPLQGGQSDRALGYRYPRHTGWRPLHISCTFHVFRLQHGYAAATASVAHGSFHLQRHRGAAHRRHYLPRRLSRRPLRSYALTPPIHPGGSTGRLAEACEGF